MLPRNLAEKVRQKGIALCTGMVLTWHCNLRCTHCFPYLPPDENLTTTDFKIKIDELTQNDCLFLNLSGGEPFLREDFSEIARYATEHNFALMLETNGTLITPRLADEIRELNFFQVKVTLFSDTETIHDRITKVKGSFRNTLGGISLLKERNINLILKTTVMQENRSVVPRIKALARRLEVGFRATPLMDPIKFGGIFKYDSEKVSV